RNFAYLYSGIWHRLGLLRCRGSDEGKAADKRQRTNRALPTRFELVVKVVQQGDSLRRLNALPARCLEGLLQERCGKGGVFEPRAERARRNLFKVHFEVLDGQVLQPKVPGKDLGRQIDADLIGYPEIRLRGFD